MNLAKQISIAAFSAAIVTAAHVSASQVDVPNSFAAGDTVVASEMNDNFGSLEAAIDDNDSRINSLENALSGPGRLFISAHELDPDLTAGSVQASAPDAVDTDFNITFMTPADFDSNSPDKMLIKPVIYGCMGTDVQIAIGNIDLSLGLNTLTMIPPPVPQIVSMPLTGVGQIHLATPEFEMPSVKDINIMRFERNGGDAADTCASTLSILGILVEYPTKG